jgi:tripartite-type tricarboxylate transporter receptor subunit TctC
VAPRLRFVAAALAALLGAANPAFAQSYPVKPVRMLAPPPGGSTDFTSRLLAEAIAPGLGQRLLVDTRAAIGIELVAQAQPDGYTILHYTNVMWLMPLFDRKTSWDPIRDFTPITMTITTPNVIVVHPSLPARNVKELIAIAKANPGQLNYGSGSTGSAAHVAAELFKSMAGVNIVRINYKSSGTSIIDLLAGHLQVMFATAGSITGHVKAGKLRALAVTSAQPSPLVPGLITVAAAGLPGYESASLSGLFGPARTPPHIVNRLNKEVATALNKPEVKDRLFASGIQVVAGTPEQAGATIKAEMARMGKVIKAADLRE